MKRLFGIVTHQFRLHGVSGRGADLGRGLTQGNPFSAFLIIVFIQPLIFLVALVLDWRRHEIVRGFADGVAVVLSSVHRLHLVLAVFLELGLASGCLLHPKKSSWVHVVPPTPAEREWWRAMGDPLEWSDLPQSDRGKYLGYLIGIAA